MNNNMLLSNLALIKVFIVLILAFIKVYNFENENSSIVYTRTDKNKSHEKLNGFYFII